METPRHNGARSTNTQISSNFNRIQSILSFDVIIGSLSKQDVHGGENVIWKCNFVFLQSFKVIVLAKCVLIILELNWNQRISGKKRKLNIYYHISHVVHTTEKQVISRRGKNENVCEMSRNEKYTCKACKTIVFHCQIFIFAKFLSPSSSWLLKLPMMELKQPQLRWRQERQNFAHFTMKNSSFPLFARAILVFVHFTHVLVLSMTWNDLLCSCVDDVSTWRQIFNSFFLSPNRSHQFNARSVSDTFCQRSKLE